MKTAIPKKRPFSTQASSLREPSAPQEIVVYHWGRIFAALFVLVLVVGGIVWGAIEIFGTGEQKEAQVENQSVEEPSLPSVFIDESESEPPSIELPKTAAREEPEVGASPPMPDQTNSVQADVAEPPASVSETGSIPETAETASSESSAEPDSPQSASQSASQSPSQSASQASEPVASVEPDSLPAPAAGESEPFPEGITSIELLSDHLIRAQLSTGLEEKEPIDEIPDVLRMDSEGLIRIYLFTEIQDMEGQLHFHDWYLEDERVARVAIRPSTDPMRASSAKYIDRHMLGDWRVEVVTEEGELLAKGAFSVLPQ